MPESSLNRLTLTVNLKDGRVLKGTYPYMQAIARYEWAKTQADFVRGELTDAE